MNYVIVSYGAYLAGFNDDGEPWLTRDQNYILMMTHEEAQGTLTLIKSMGYNGKIQEYI